MSALHSMFEDGQNGSLSSRRVITFLAFLLCSIAFIANLFFSLRVEEYIFNSMSYIAMAGLGFTVAEKFAGSSSSYNSFNSFQQPINNQPFQSQDGRIHGTPLPPQQDQPI